jgi:hypothetical protein
LQAPVKIIVIFPYRFREFDNDRFEIECLKRYSSVIVHELINTLHKNFTVAYHTRDQSKHIKRFSSLLEWRKEYLETIRLCETKPYVINFVSTSTFKELIVNYVLSSSDVFLIKYNNPGVPSYNSVDSFFSKIHTKYKFILKRATFKWLIFTTLSIFTRYLSLLFIRKNDYNLVVNHSYNDHSNGLISINSFDYSMFIRQTRGDKFKDEHKDIIVYLDTGAPLFKTDSFLSGNKHPLTTESWYPSLVNFFDIIEDKTSKTVVIAAHPKHHYSSDMKHYFGNRDIFHGETQSLVAQADLVLITNSTAVSYAVMYNKPVLILLSDELISDDNILLKESNYLANILGCSSINIDKADAVKSINFPINKIKYLKYKSKYLSSRMDNKTNCEIIVDEVINNEQII